MTDETKVVGRTFDLVIFDDTPSTADPAEVAAYHRALVESGALKPRPKPTLKEALEQCARELPKHWSVGVEVEVDSAWVFLVDPRGRDVCGFVACVDDTIPQQVLSALAYAKSNANNEEIAPW